MKKQIDNFCNLDVFQRKIRAEWEAKMEQEKKLMEEKERLERQLKEKQVHTRGF